MKMAAETNHKQSQSHVFSLISIPISLYLLLYIQQEPNQCSQAKVTRTNPNSLSRDTKKQQGILLNNKHIFYNVAMVSISSMLSIFF